MKPESLLLPVMRNANRLLQDAELLYKNERYPSAVSIAIASIEEAGKYVILARGAHHGATTGKKKAKHETKHYELGRFYWLMATWNVIKETFDDFKSWLQTQPDLADYYNKIKDYKQQEAVSYLQTYMFQSEKELEAYIKERFPHREELEVRGHAQAGRIEELRRTGLYCDINSEFQVIKDPENLTKADSEKWLAHAGIAMVHMRLWHDILTGKVK